MSIWAIADLHLCFSTPEKNMAIFGPKWEGYQEKIQANWSRVVAPHDLVLLAGDLSWASHFTQALTDLYWIDALPGTKVIIRGNHDYWWPSNKKLSEGLPPSLHFIHQTAFHWNGVAIGGTRLWETEEYQFALYLAKKEPKQAVEKKEELQDNHKIFQRELTRLEKSLEQMDKKAKMKIAMTHYPPIGADLLSSRTSKILDTFGINLVVFGHLHGMKEKALPFGEKNGIRYSLTSADYLDFQPLLLYKERQSTSDSR